jgi:hypothetical protein
VFVCGLHAGEAGIVLGMKKETIAEIFTRGFNEKRVEPTQRLVGGKFGWAVHRFPIKGGISLSQVFVRNVAKENALLKCLLKRGK